MMDLFMKYEELGRLASVLMELHLKDPKEWNSVCILDKMFSKAESLGIVLEMEIEEENRDFY